MSAGSNAPRLRMVSLGLGGAEKVDRVALQQTYGSIQIWCLHRSGKMPRADRGCHRPHWTSLTTRLVAQARIFAGKAARR